MRTLVLITSNFPFGRSEPFIETEFPFLYKEYKKIIIITQNVSSEQSRDIPKDPVVFRYNPATSIPGFIFLPVLILKNLSLILTILRDELIFRKHVGSSLSLRQKRFLVKKIIKAVQLRDFIRLVLKKENISSDILFYSYWLNSGAHAIALLNFPDSIRVARIHRGDLYEEVSRFSYLPLLRYSSERLDSLFFISEHGRRYFVEKTRSLNPYLFVSRLGVMEPKIEKTGDPDVGLFTIVSCSTLIPLKRVDLIIKSLELIDYRHRMVRWIHFGDGVKRQELEKLAREKLKKESQLSYEFRGYVPVKEILDYYRINKINLFINTSTSEGIPVSIMEAQSFGIPVIATDVGGVSEIVTEDTGFLLPADFRPEELAGVINRYLKLKPEEENKIRIKVLSAWRQNYNASANYADFINKVNSIFDLLTTRHNLQDENK